MMETKAYIDGFFQRAGSAQGKFESYNQEQVDAAVRAIAKTVYDHAEELAGLAVSETGMGVYEDKVIKNRMKAKIIWNSLKGKKSVGIIGRNEKTGITEIAKPMGVVAAITPMTNPIVTPMSNAMFALKGRNAIIITPHHRAAACSKRTVDLMREALVQASAPADLIQIIDLQSRENTKNLIERADIVIATGGMGMVKAAYSSGKPALGVGAGNVQCILDEDADISTVIPMVITGRAFDNGILCSAEQSIIAPESRKAALYDALRDNKTYVVTDEEDRNKLRDALFQYGTMNKAVIGQNIGSIAQLAGLSVPLDTRVIAVQAENAADILGKEKMCPVLALYFYETFEEAVAIAKSNLEREGKGHSVAIHSHSTAHIEYAANALSVSRFVINQCSATSAGGSFYNGFAPTNTLGCGSWGGNSISENLDYKHLINISRIGYYMPNNPVPTEEELWK